MNELVVEPYELLPQVKPLRHYVIVRSDLPVEVKFAQIGHAAGESAVLGTPPTNKTVFLALQGTAQEMEAVIPALEKRGYRYVRVIEDAQPYAGQFLAIGIEPSIENRLRKVLYDFEEAKP